MKNNKKIKDSISYILKKGGFKYALIGVVFLMFVLLILPSGLPAIIFNSMNEQEYYCVKDDNDFYNTRNKKIGSTIYDASFAQTDDTEVDENVLNNISKLDFTPIILDEGKISIYLKNYNIDDETANLCIDYLNDDKKDIVIKNINKNFYKLNNDKSTLVYIRTENEKSNLYYHDFSKENLICENVDSFYTDDDFKNIYYNQDNDLYSFINLADNKLIATASEIIIEKNEISFDKILRNINYKHILITKTKNVEDKTKDIYKILPDNSILLVSADVTGTPIAYYADDFIYYYKQQKEQMRVSDYVVDDISDGSFFAKEPNINNYYEGFGFFAIPDYFSYYSDKGAFDQVAGYIRRNQETIDKYVDQIKRGTYNNNYNNLYCYDGKEEYLLCEDMVRTTKRVHGIKPYIYFESYINDKLEQIDKINLSDIISRDLTVNNYMKTIRQGTRTYKYIYHKKEGMRIEGMPEADAEVYRLKNKFAIKYVQGSTQAVYTVMFTPGQVTNSELVGSHMTNELKLFASPYIDDVIYSVMNSNVNAYLFLNGQRIEDQIMKSYVNLSNDLKTVVYFVEYDSVHKTGKLKLLKDGKTKIIEENVLVTSVKTNASNGQIYFINNFNNVTISGDFYRYDDYNHKRLVSNNVMSIINDHLDDEYIDILKSKDNGGDKYTVAGKDFGETEYTGV